MAVEWLARGRMTSVDGTWWVEGPDGGHSRYSFTPGEGMLPEKESLAALLRAVESETLERLRRGLKEWYLEQRWLVRDTENVRDEMAGLIEKARVRP